jgi:hypothetical protein
MKKIIRFAAVVALLTAVAWSVWTFLTWFIISTICEILDIIGQIASLV